MKRRIFLLALVIITFSCRLAGATQADDTTIIITAQNPGVTPFISKLSLMASNTSVIKSIRFTITPRTGSATRPLSAIYSTEYLVARGYLNKATGEILLPVYGLYAKFANNVTLTYGFTDGSSKQARTTVTTAAFDDPCGYENPTRLQGRTTNRSLSYDYIFVKGRCSDSSPAIMDTDSALRWVGPGGITSFTSVFFDNAVYITQGTTLYRIELDGSVKALHNYSDIGVIDFHHNIERGKDGLILEVDTSDVSESIDIEVDKNGNVLKMWNLADIISAAMIAGGDDPVQFVAPAPADWFHNNAATFNRADNSLIISSRENFVICLDYDTDAIKWILGDPTKKWHQFPSLSRYAFALAAGSLPPIGQHSTSLTFDQKLLLFDNGQKSDFQIPYGAQRNYASPRKYDLNVSSKVATEIWNYEMDQAILCPICGSIYEDAPLNYLIDYAFVGGFDASNNYAQLLGLDTIGRKVFHYRYPTVFCDTAYNSIPLHFENTAFPTIGPRAHNLSARGLVGSNENVLIAGFIVTGTDSETVVLRAIGPSLGQVGLAGVLADPVLTLYDASGAIIATNDNWQSDSNASQITAAGLAPTDPAEAALLVDLVPGAYTAVVRSKDSTSGIGLIEVYDLAPVSNSKLANISTRGSVGTGNNIFVGGFILGDVASNTVVIRALGPSLASAGVTTPLNDPRLTVYDSNGSPIATNNNWRDNDAMLDIEKNGLAPSNLKESAIILNLPAGAYTTIVSGADNGTGISLVELYDLNAVTTPATKR